MAFLLTIGAPLKASLQAAVHPYTAEGKGELCATRIRSVALALAAYAQDNAGSFPPLDYQINSRNHGPRVTWVSLVHDRPEALAQAGSFECPAGPGLPRDREQQLSSYVMNPVLASAMTREMDNAAATVLLADGGSKHDVSLLPPYPTWPAMAARPARARSGAAPGFDAPSFDATACNFDFRHSGQAAVVYADAHAGMLPPGAWALESPIWGGRAVMRRARSRIVHSSPQAQELMRLLHNADVAGAASYLAAHRNALKPVSRALVDLWRCNTGADRLDGVEEMGWDLARAWKRVGDPTWETQLKAIQAQR
jgi:prepilin-type processing-associated H-X9-DG protein